MTVNELRTEMRDEFQDVRTEMRAEFEDVRTEMRTEFQDVRTEMRTEFEAVRTEMRTEFKAVRTEMRTEFKNVRTEISDLRIELMTAMSAEGETTRRHFDVVAEQFRDYTKVLADGIARNTERLDDHEKRITFVEGSG